MACSMIQRKGTSIKKDSEMTSGRFLTKKRKVEYPTNGEPLHVEVRASLKGHRPLLFVETIFNTVKRMQLLCHRVTHESHLTTEPSNHLCSYSLEVAQYPVV